MKLKKNQKIYYKLQINPEKKKSIKQKTKNFVENPGVKLGIINESVGNYNNPKYIKISDSNFENNLLKNSLNNIGLSNFIILFA